MDIEIEIIKGIPVEQINNFENKAVYDCAVYTRDFTKQDNAYPYLTGALRKEETASPIIGSNKEYGLTGGVDYAVSVWKKTNANWTNPNTQPQWYKSVFNKHSGTIVSGAVVSALKEV